MSGLEAFSVFYFSRDILPLYMAGLEAGSFLRGPKVWVYLYFLISDFSLPTTETKVWVYLEESQDFLISVTTNSTSKSQQVKELRKSMQLVAPFWQSSSVSRPLSRTKSQISHINIRCVNVHSACLVALDKQHAIEGECEIFALRHLAQGPTPCTVFDVCASHELQRIEK